jgi:hypothetical protein
MRIGDLVQVKSSKCAEQWPGRESIFAGMIGTILLDHSPQRAPNIGRVVDVMWNNGNIEDMYSDDLVVINENR